MRRSITLVDTGPIVAMIDAKEPHHHRCRLVLEQLRVPLITTVACLTEAMYLLGEARGFVGQEALWRYLAARAIVLEELTGEDLPMVRSYMEGFRDVPCDFADATLLSVAERLDCRRVFTLDSHFHVYRVSGQVIEVVA